MNNPFDIKQAKNYFKKNDFELPSHLDAERIDPIAQLEVENEEEMTKQQKKDQLNA